MENPYIRFIQSPRSGKFRLQVKNTGNTPVVAFVCVLAFQPEPGNTKTTTYKSIYTESKSLGPGKMAEVAVHDKAIPVGAIQVDYIRLADGTEWGERKTEAGRATAAQFQKSGRPAV